MRMFHRVTAGRAMAGFYAASVAIATRAALHADKPVDTAPRSRGLIDRLRHTGRRLADRVRRLLPSRRDGRVPVNIVGQGT